MIIETILAMTLRIDPHISAATYRPLSIEQVAERRPAALIGWQPSADRGMYWQPGQASFRRCVMARESHANYRAENQSSTARGAYQFLDRSWRRGLAFMMSAESRQTGDGLARKALALRSVEISHWSRYWQDRAFFTALNIRGRWSGAFHWRSSTRSC